MTDFVLILGVYVLTLVAGALIATGVWMLHYRMLRSVRRFVYSPVLRVMYTAGHGGYYPHGGGSDPADDCVECRWMYRFVEQEPPSHRR